MNRVLLDQGLAPSTAALLRLDGDWDAVHVSELGMSHAADEEILTNLALSRSDGSSVVLVRIEGLDSRRQAVIATSTKYGNDTVR